MLRPPASVFDGEDIVLLVETPANIRIILKCLGPWCGLKSRRILKFSFRDLSFQDYIHQSRFSPECIMINKILINSEPYTCLFVFKEF